MTGPILNKFGKWAYLNILFSITHNLVFRNKTLKNSGSEVVMEGGINCLWMFFQSRFYRYHYFMREI